MNLSRLALVLGSILALAVGYRAVDAQVERWSTTAGSNNSAPPLGAPEAMAPSAVNDVIRENMKEVRRFAQQGVSPHFAPDGGAANVYMISPAILPSATRISGAVFRFIPAFTNTGTSTLRVGSITPVELRKINGDALAAGDLTAGRMTEVVDNGTYFVITSASAGSAGTETLPAQSISGTVLSTNGSTASFISAAFLDIAPRGFIGGYNITPASLTTVTVARGSATDDTGSTMIRLDTPLTKSVAGTWVAGSGNGLDTGTVENNQWYHVLAIRSVAGVKDVLLTKTITSVTMPAGYQWKRRIGSFRTDSSAQVIPAHQNGDEFLWTGSLSFVEDVNVTGGGSAAVTRTLRVPTGVQVWAKIIAAVNAPSAAENMLITSLDAPDITPARPGAQIHSDGGGDYIAHELVVRTNTSAQVRTRTSSGAGSNNLRVLTTGWIDRRGKDD